MSNDWICERCLRKTMRSFTCQSCHRGVCKECIVFPKGKQFCLDCAEGGKKVKVLELVPA